MVIKNYCSPERSEGLIFKTLEMKNTSVASNLNAKGFEKFLFFL